MPRSLTNVKLYAYVMQLLQPKVHTSGKNTFESGQKMKKKTTSTLLAFD